MNRTDCQQIIIDTVYQDLDLYSDLHELLLKQQGFILQRDHQALSESSGRITSLMIQARESRKKRSQALEQIQLSNTQAGMDAFLQRVQYKHREELTEDWDELMDIVEDCKEINQVNDQALTLQYEMTEELLEKLQIHTDDSKTYSCSGQEQQSSQSILTASA